MNATSADGGRRAARAAIKAHSKSFALASKLLPAGVRDDAVVLYAYCRRADDAVDLAPAHERSARLAQLRQQLRDLYRGRPCDDALLAELRSTTTRRRIPQRYLEDLLLGLQMDVEGRRYDTLAELLVYCYRVAGVVGLMLCHVMGVRDAAALRHAAHLGIAMQLTNICRDVLEDWERGRLYLPDDVLAACGGGGLARELGAPLSHARARRVTEAISRLLDLADDYYHSGDAGLRYLGPRCRLAVRTARLVYSHIGRRLRRQGCDPLGGRAIVPRATKLALAARAAAGTLATLPLHWLSPPPALPAPSDVDPRKLVLLETTTS